MEELIGALKYVIAGFVVGMLFGVVLITYIPDHTTKQYLKGYEDALKGKPYPYPNVLRDDTLANNHK